MVSKEVTKTTSGEFSLNKVYVVKTCSYTFCSFTKLAFGEFYERARQQKHANQKLKNMVMIKSFFKGGVETN